MKLKIKMKSIIKLSITFAVICILFAFSILGSIYYTAAHSSPQKSDAIIVLGCQVYGENPSLSLEYRLETALDLYKSGYAPKIIVSGGQGENEKIPESTAMKHWLVNHGVDKDIIYEENKSTSTYENLKFSKVIMEENKVKSVIIVTNDFHVFRSLRLADRLEIQATAAPAPTVSYLKVPHNLREVFAVIKNYVLYG